MRQLDVRQRPLVGRAHVGVDHLFARRLVDRQRSGGLQMADHLRGAGPLAEQLNELAVQFIDSISQFFQRHFILVLRPSPVAVQAAAWMHGSWSCQSTERR